MNHPYAEVLRWVIACKRIEINVPFIGWELAEGDDALLSITSKWPFKPEDFRLAEADHAPDGWPAVQMKQISALCDEIERITRNRDMWKAQCGAQAEQLAQAREALLGLLK